MRLGVATHHDWASAGRALHLGRHLVPDLEGTGSNVRADRCDHLCGVVLHSLHGLACDIRDRAAPSCMHRGHVAARRVRNQDRNAVGRPRGDAEPLVTRNQRIAFEVHDLRSPVGARDLTGLVAMYLPLLEQVVYRETQALCKACAVFPDRLIIVAQMKSKIERVERSGAHTPCTCRKTVLEPMPIEKDGMEHTHSAACSTASLRKLRLHAKEPTVRAWSWLLHRFPSAEWAAAYQIALNNNPSYRDAGKCWTFGSVAMVVLGDPTIGLACDVGVVLDVHGGECRGAQFVEGIDSLKAAEFTFVASYARWQEVIEAKLDPIKGLMEGKLKLASGDLSTIVRFIEAARQLVVSASQVPTSFLSGGP